MPGITGLLVLMLWLTACTGDAQNTSTTRTPAPTLPATSAPDVSPRTSAPRTPTAEPSPTPSPTPSPEPTPTPTPTPTPSPTPTPTATPATTYVVRPGDTLNEIAGRFDVSAERLRAWNHERYPSLATNPDLLEVAWTLELTGPPDATLPPQPTPDPTPNPTPEPTDPPNGGLYVDDYCTVRDWLTPYRDYEQHHLTLLDWTYMVGPEYAPPDLVSTSNAGFAGVSGDKLIRQIVLPDLAALRQAAAGAGHALEVQSAYRSYATQAGTFDYWVSQVGFEEAVLVSARPGHSQHQLGTTIDFTSGGVAPWQYGDWGTTPTGAWMADKAWRYGWVLTYPQGGADVACYTYEPWHFRWVGRDVAADWRASGLIFHEYQVRLGE